MTDGAPVTLQEITDDNLRQVMDLDVLPHQQYHVAPNSRSIAEACFADEVWMRAVYAGDEPVGFVLLSERRSAERYYLWRFMIDHRHQGNGYGKEAMLQVVDHVRAIPGASEMFLSYVPDERGPRGFYAGLGFEDTGREHDGEREMRLAL